MFTGVLAMKVAVIDIGSNSIRLLAAYYDYKTIVSFYRELITTRLGSGVAKNNMIDERSTCETISAVKGFVKKARDFDCDEILSLATSAIREAANGPDFLNLLKAETGLDVKVVSGEEEARLSFLGSRAGLGIAGLTFVVDIGGSSTELSLGDDTSIIKSISLPMGAVRWTQRYFKSDVPTCAEVEQAVSATNEMLSEFSQDFRKKKLSGQRVKGIGVGGTLTTLAAINLGLEVYDSKIIHGLYLSSDDIIRIYHKLLLLSTKEKKKIPGLSPQRADIITAGALIMHEIIRQLDLSGITVSEADIMEGFILRELNAYRNDMNRR